MPSVSGRGEPPFDSAIRPRASNGSIGGFGSAGDTLDHPRSTQKNGSSRITGEGSADLEEEVLLIPVAVG
ncbi:hypothetical protein, partial [Burkholderia alba]|uniref:hypothetical protein n=1 Tax=Burkholderia alba TaxID=2683677 RepID=UPI002B051BD1